jgi:hypothetical protein
MTTLLLKQECARISNGQIWGSASSEKGDVRYQVILSFKNVPADGGKSAGAKGTFDLTVDNDLIWQIVDGGEFAEVRRRLVQGGLPIELSQDATSAKLLPAK